MEKENKNPIIKYVMKYSYGEERRGLIRKSKYQKVSYIKLHPNKTIMLNRVNQIAELLYYCHLYRRVIQKVGNKGRLHILQEFTIESMIRKLDDYYMRLIQLKGKI